DLEGLRAAARAVAQTCAAETLVIVRSTSPIGASRSVVLPELAARWGGARLAFCPERTIQGQALRELEQLPQVVGGLDGARVALLGFAYKGWPPTDDMRGAPVVPMLEVLRAAPVALVGHDFLVAPQIIRELGVEPRTLEEVFDEVDGVLVITDHPE